MRYLAELAWAPHAMLDNPRLSRREIDATTSKSRPRARPGPARVRLIFENGDITRVEADDRPRAAGLRIVPTRWQGRCRDYREVDGYRIPTGAVASWQLEYGLSEYRRSRVTAVGMK